jgi:hypothetical protein
MRAEPRVYTTLKIFRSKSREALKATSQRDAAQDGKSATALPRM